MILSKKKFRLVSKIIDTWKKNDVITDDVADRLKHSIEPARFDWNRMARYSFWIAGISLAISVFAVLLDEMIMAVLMELFRMPDIVKSILLALVSAAFYFWGFKRRKGKPEKFYTSEFLLFIGAMVTGAAIIFFGQAVDTGSGHYSLLILMATLVYLGIGGAFPSAPMWVLGLISLGSWFGTETGYVSGWGAYFLGMNYPLRFVLFGAVLVLLSFLVGKTRLRPVKKSTFIIGLLNLFIALWIMSIWGNYGDMSVWHAASVLERFIWSLVFGAAAIGAIVWGLKNDDAVARGFGITFLFINLYTKYFEYFWEVSHKAIFFAVLAISFWLVGRYSEKAFNTLKEKLVEMPDED